MRLQDFDGTELGIGVDSAPDARSEVLAERYLSRAASAERAGSYALAQVYRDAAADVFEALDGARATARALSDNPAHGGTL